MQFCQLVHFLRTTDGLTHLERNELADDPRPRDENEKEGQDGSESRPDRDILEDIEKTERISPTRTGGPGLFPLFV